MNSGSDLEKGIWHNDKWESSFSRIFLNNIEWIIFDCKSDFSSSRVAVFFDEKGRTGKIAYAIPAKLGVAAVSSTKTTTGPLPDADAGKSG